MQERETESGHSRRTERIRRAARGIVPLLFAVMLLAGPSSVHAQDGAGIRNETDVGAGGSGVQDEVNAGAAGSSVRDEVNAGAAESGAQEETDVGAGGSGTRDEADGSGKVEELLSWLEGQLLEGSLTAEQDVRTAIEAGEERFGIRLPDGARDAIVSVVTGCQSLGLEPGFLVDQAAAIYERYGEDITEDSGGSIFRILWEAVKDLLLGLWNFLKDCFTYLFGES